MTTAKPRQMGQTRTPVLSRETDVREETREAVRCFFNDLWRLNGDRPRGSPSKDLLERGRRLQQPHRDGGRKHTVREEQQTHTGGSVVALQFWSARAVRHQQMVSKTETHCLPQSITGQFGD
jgi:hypothetical protein